MFIYILANTYAYTVHTQTRTVFTYYYMSMH